MPTTWSIAVDWDRDGSFANTNDDITSYVLDANWFLGFRQSYSEVAENSTLTLTLRNTDKRFSPENASSPLFGKLLPLRPVRVQSNDGTTTRTHWLGWVETLQPLPGVLGSRVVTINASGALQFLKIAETKLPLQENKRSDEVVDALMKEVIIPPALTQAFLLDVPGSSEMGISTYLADTDSYKQFETGVLTFNLAGDNWVNNGGLANKPKDTFEVMRAIGDVVSAERGKFFFNRGGQVVFWNRHHLLMGKTPIATFTNAMNDLSYEFAGTEVLKNEIIVKCHPRSISLTDTDVLWTLDDAVIRLDGSKTRTINIKFDDEGDKRVGARDISVTDLVCVPATVSVSIKSYATGAELTFSNSGTASAEVRKCIVRGRKILDSGEIEIEARDGLKIANYGRRSMRLNLSSLDDPEEAQYIADFELMRRKEPRGSAASITLLSHATRGGNQHAQQLALTIGDCISIVETQTVHNSLYFVVGEAHELTEAGTLWETTLYLEPAPLQTFFMLGTSTLNSTDIVAY